MRIELRVLALSTLLATGAMGAMPAANAAPTSPNGSFGLVPFGVVTAATSGGWQVGPNTTTITIPASELVNTSTNGGTYLGNPENLEIPMFNFATFSYLTFNIPNLNTATTLATALTVTVTNAVNDVLTFTYTSITATSSGNGSLDLNWSGNVTADTAGAYVEPSPASMSAAFTATQSTAVGNASFSLASPPAPVQEPASMALLGAGTLALGVVRRRALVLRWATRPRSSNIRLRLEVIGLRVRAAALSAAIAKHRLVQSVHA